MEDVWECSWICRLVSRVFGHGVCGIVMSGGRVFEKVPLGNWLGSFSLTVERQTGVSALVV